eukprot:5652151-Amphidinium_carterae.1
MSFELKILECDARSGGGRPSTNLRSRPAIRRCRRAVLALCTLSRSIRRSWSSVRSLMPACSPCSSRYCSQLTRSLVAFAEARC